MSAVPADGPARSACCDTPLLLTHRGWTCPRCGALDRALRPVPNVDLAGPAEPPPDPPALHDPTHDEGPTPGRGAADPSSP